MSVRAAPQQPVVHRSGQEQQQYQKQRWEQQQQQQQQRLEQQQQQQQQQQAAVASVDDVDDFFSGGAAPPASAAAPSFPPSTFPTPTNPAAPLRASVQPHQPPSSSTSPSSAATARLYAARPSPKQAGADGQQKKEPAVDWAKLEAEDKAREHAQLVQQQHKPDGGELKFYVIRQTGSPEDLGPFCSYISLSINAVNLRALSGIQAILRGSKVVQGQTLDQMERPLIL